MRNLDLNEFISRLKSIISLAKRFNTHSGIRSSIPELEKIRNDFIKQGHLEEGDVVSLVIEFLRQERDEIDLKRKRLADLTAQMSLEVPIGRLVTFRNRWAGNLVGSVVGFLADRVLIKVGDLGEMGDICEVSPLDIKL
jgi:hypothetical protein